MKLAATLTACLLATAASAADLVAKGDNSILVLSQKPCSEEILAMIPPLMRDEFRGGNGRLGKQSQQVCWTDYDENQYLVIFADGSGAGFPKRIFKLDEGV